MKQQYLSPVVTIPKLRIPLASYKSCSSVNLFEIAVGGILNYGKSTTKDWLNTSKWFLFKMYIGTFFTFFYPTICQSPYVCKSFKLLIFRLAQFLGLFTLCSEMRRFSFPYSKYFMVSKRPNQ
jgi:hypothetical protein